MKYEFLEEYWKNRCRVNLKFFEENLEKNVNIYEVISNYYSKHNLKNFQKIIYVKKGLHLINNEYIKLDTGWYIESNEGYVVNIKDIFLTEEEANKEIDKGGNK